MTDDLQHVLNALREANPVPEIEQPRPAGGDIDAALESSSPRRDHRQRGRWFLVAAVITALIVLGLRLPPGDPDDPVLAGVERSGVVDDFCDVTLRDIDMDPTDPGSVEAAFQARLSFDLMRRAFAPDHLIDEAELVAEHSRELSDRLGAAAWNLSEVDVEQPPAVVSASRELDDWFDGECR